MASMRGAKELFGFGASRGAGVLLGLRSAMRQARRAPRAMLGAALVMAVGLGSAAWSWGLEYGYYGRGLPVSHPDRMMTLRGVDRERHTTLEEFSVDDLEALASTVPGVDGLGLWGATAVDLGDGSRPPDQVTAQRVTPSMFGLLELVPAQGRTLVAADADAGSPRTAVLSHRYWHRRYDGNPRVIGREVLIQGRPTVVVGVLSPRSYFYGHEDVWIPIRAEERSARQFQMLLRLSPGQNNAAFQASLDRFRLPPGTGEDITRAAITLRALPFTESFRDDQGPGSYLWVVSRTGLLLFLMAFANLTNLLLVRTRIRRREFAVRRALGASRARVVGTLAAEAMVLAALAIAGGTAIAAAALGWYQHASDIYAGGLGPSWSVYSFGAPHLALIAGGALVGTLGASLIAGLLALWKGQSQSLRESRGNSSSGFGFARGLVAAEIAIGMGLLLLCGLLLKGAWNLRTTEWGFATGNVLTGHVSLDPHRYPTPEDRIRFWRGLESELTAAPGVEEATLATQLPMIRYARDWDHVRGIEIEGMGSVEPARLPSHYVDAVTPSFFEAFEAPVRVGRPIERGDGASGAAPVVVVNEPFARRYFPDSDPVGRSLRVWTEAGPGPWRTVVGVAPHLWMDTDVNESPEGVYVPLAEHAPRGASVAIRVRGDPGGYADALRSAVWGLDPDIPVVDMLTMVDLIRTRTRLYRRNGPPLVWIGLAALIMAVAGLYAVVSFITSVQTREYAIRGVLGATPQRLLGRAVMSHALAVLGGLAAGSALGLWLTRGFSRLLFQVDPTSPAIVTATAMFLVLVALAAILFPVARMIRSEPMEVLASE